MADIVVDITALETRLAALESAVEALQSRPALPESGDIAVAIAKVHELVRAWSAVPQNGWRSVGDF